MESVETGAYAAALFEMFEELPLVAAHFIDQYYPRAHGLLLITFFVTTSDSGSLVVDMITAGGMESVETGAYAAALFEMLDTPAAQRVFWCTADCRGVCCNCALARRWAAVAAGCDACIRFTVRLHPYWNGNLYVDSPSESDSLSQLWKR